MKGRRHVYFDRLLEAPICDRARLRAGNVFAGPAIVEEPGGTTVVWPGQAVRVDARGNLVVTWAAGGGGTPPEEGSDVARG